jgi:hypothetical protein
LRCLALVNALTDSELKSPQMTEDAKAKDYTVDVFISYRRADVGFADRLYKLFAARRLSVWYDALIAPGADWRDAIVQHLEKAKLMVIVLSAHSLGSKELKKELAVADLEDVPLLAIRLEEVRPRESFAYELARGNWFDIFPDPEAQLAKLVDYLEVLSKDQSRIRTELERSLTARRERPAWEAKRSLYRDFLLLLLCLLFSAVEFALYERATNPSPTEELIRSGKSPLQALGYVLIATTLGSPLLLLALLQGELSGVRIPLLIVAAANTVLLLLLARNLFFRAVRLVRHMAHRRS